MPNMEPNELSERELDILKLVATGASNKEIAQKLFISSNTVKVHLRNIFTKIGVTSRTEAAMYAVRNDLVGTKSTQGVSVEDQNTLLEINSQSEQSVSLEIYPEKNILSKKQYFRYLGIFGALLITVVIFAFAYLREKLNPPNLSIAATPTQRIQWFSLPGPPTPRRGLAVTSYENQIYAIGGESAQGVTNAVERYDPQTNLWSVLTSKSIPVSEISAGVIGGLIYVPGGKLDNGSVTDKTEIYDPISDRWIAGVSLPKPISAYGLVVSEGQIYIFGGWDGNQISNNAFVFDPQKNSWTEISPLPTPRSFPGAVAVGRKIYSIGGWDGQKPLSNTDVYVPDTPGSEAQWTTASPLPSGRFGMGVTNLADIIFIIGGSSGEDELTAIALSQEDNDWEQLEAPVQKGWNYLGATTAGTRLYTLGGSIDDVLTDQMWAYQAIFTITLPIVR